MDSVSSHGVSRIELENKACAGRVNGKGGRTRIKIENATGCQAEMRHTCLEMRGTEEQLRLASVVIHCILASFGNEGIHLDDSDTRENCTILQIPKSTSRMVIGRGGEHLHAIEEEASTIMFIADMIGNEANAEMDNLAIFGKRDGRRLSQLLVMGLVESIQEGCFTDEWHKSGLTYETPFDCIGDWGTHVRELSDEEDMAFIIGKNSHTRLTLMKASECIIARVGSLLFISGEKKARMRTWEYIDWLLQQRLRRNAYVDFVGISNPQDREDCTIIQIPDDCVAYITGAQRQTLNRLETSWGVLVFSLADRILDDEQSFAIVGPARARIGANLEIKSWIEHQMPGSFEAGTEKHISSDRGFGLDYIPFDADEARFICGKQGGTQKKLMTASHAIIQFIGNLCVIAGTRDERRRCHDYIQLLLPMMRGRNHCVDSSGCSDITEIKVPSDRVHLLSQNTLQDLELATGTFMVLSKSVDAARLLICGWELGSASAGRKKAQQEVAKLLGRETSCKASDRLLAGDAKSSTQWSDFKHTSASGETPRSSSAKHRDASWRGNGSSGGWHTSGFDETWRDTSRDYSDKNWTWTRNSTAGHRSRSRAWREDRPLSHKGRLPTPPRPPLRRNRPWREGSHQPPW